MLPGIFPCLGVGHDPRALVKIRRERGIAPTMTVDADLAVAEKVIEQDKLTSQTMLVRCDRLSIDRQFRFPVADRLAGCIFHIAKDLIVSAVFLDDEDHIFDRARLADSRRYHAVARNRTSREIFWSIQ